MWPVFHGLLDVLLVLNMVRFHAVRRKHIMYERARCVDQAICAVAAQYENTNSQTSVRSE